MFEVDQLVADCRAVLHEDRAQAFIREIAARAVSEPGEVLRTLGEPQRAELKTLYRAPDLTVLNVIWAPWMTLLPHNHQMWAVIGIYTGREDNIFWRRVGGQTEAPQPHSTKGALRLRSGQALSDPPTAHPIAPKDGAMRVGHPHHDSRQIEAAGARALSVGDAEPLGRDVIHSVTNPIPRLTGAVHIYGGDFFAPGRSEWDAETLIEQACDPERIAARFAEANAALAPRLR